MFSSADESLKNETRLQLLWVGSLVALYTIVFTHITCGKACAHLYGEEQSF